MSTPQRRSHFRITYEKEHAPKLAYSGCQFPVLDVSEEGIRFRAEGVKGMKIDDDVIGTLTFEDGEVFIVRGPIVRIQKSDISVKLKKAAIPLRKIMSEQRRLIQKFEKYK